MTDQTIRIQAAVGGESFPSLNGRQKQVLKEVCESFISTGIPVGSRTISRFGGLACSPATIRNEMADLESLGYLFSPHTSAGRVPTEMGFRFYVNSLIEYGRLCQIEEKLVTRLIEKFEAERAHQKAVLQSAVRFASEVTHLTGVLLTPQKASRKLRSIQVVRLFEDQVLLVTVDDCGRISEQIFGIPANTSDESLRELTRLLNTEICNRELFDTQNRVLREMQQILSQHNQLLQTLL
nr:hypothetical protein [Candidatus Ozemobacteraceae bacterium]